METRTEARPSPVALVLGIIGGALLAIGSFMTWASVSVDTNALVDKLASALNVDPALLQGQVPTTGLSQSVSGMKGGSDGTITLVAGILVLVFAVVLFVKFDLHKVMGGLMVAAGVVGAGVALWDLGKLNDAKDAALADAGPSLQALGLDANTLSDVIKVCSGRDRRDHRRYRGIGAEGTDDGGPSDGCDVDGHPLDSGGNGIRDDAFPAAGDAARGA